MISWESSFFLMELCGKANAIDLPLRMGFSFHKNGDDLGMVAMALVHAPGSISLDGVPGPDLSGMDDHWSISHLPWTMAHIIIIRIYYRDHVVQFFQFFLF